MLSDTTRDPAVTDGDLFLSACLREKCRSSDFSGSNVILSERFYSRACARVAKRAYVFSFRKGEIL